MSVLYSCLMNHHAHDISDVLHRHVACRPNFRRLLDSHLVIVDSFAEGNCGAFTANDLRLAGTSAWCRFWFAGALLRKLN